MKEILVQEGDIAKVGQGLCVIEVDEDGPNVSETEGEAKPVEQATSDDAASDSKVPVGLEPEPSRANPVPTKARRPHPLDPAHPPPPRSSSSGARSSLASSSTSLPSDLPTFSRRSSLSSKITSSDGPALAMPSVRHFAKKNGIEDLSVLKPGSGKDGRIEMGDVKAYLEGGSKDAEKAVAPTNATTAASESGAKQESIEIDMGRTRLAMFKAMTKVCNFSSILHHSTLIRFRTFR